MTATPLQSDCEVIAKPLFVIYDHEETATSPQSDCEVHDRKAAFLSHFCLILLLRRITFSLINDLVVTSK